jgi:prophage antirepressor-like protein
MNAITPFVFEDQLVRSVLRGSEPWFVGKDVCTVLDIAKHHQALERLDDDERGTCTVGTPSGEQTVIIISEPGVFRLIFTSRKPSAERFKRWLAHEVLPALRKTGKFSMDASPDDDVIYKGNSVGVFKVEHEAVPLLRIKLDLVECSRKLWGHERARSLWNVLDLPYMLELPRGDGVDRAMEIIATLKWSKIGAETVDQVLTRAVEDDAEAQGQLAAHGLIVDVDQECIYIANNHPALRGFLAKTKWATGHWQDLRRLQGTAAGGRRSFGDVQSRATVVPLRLFDLTVGYHN